MIGGYKVVSLILPRYCSTVGKSKNIKKGAKNN